MSSEGTTSNSGSSNNDLSPLLEDKIIKDAFLTADANGIIRACNSSLNRLFGYDKDDKLIGSNISLLMPDPISKQHDKYVQNHIQTGQSKILNKMRMVQARHKDGHMFPILIEISRVQAKGEIVFSAHMQNYQSPAAKSRKDTPAPSTARVPPPLPSSGPPPPLPKQRNAVATTSSPIAATTDNIPTATLPFVHANYSATLPASFSNPELALKLSRHSTEMDAAKLRSSSEPSLEESTAAAKPKRRPVPVLSPEEIEKETAHKRTSSLDDDPHSSSNSTTTVTALVDSNSYSDSGNSGSESKQSKRKSLPDMKDSISNANKPTPPPKTPPATKPLPPPKQSHLHAAGQPPVASKASSEPELVKPSHPPPVYPAAPPPPAPIPIPSPVTTSNTVIQQPQFDSFRWEIEYQDLKLGASVGKGSCGEVFAANWHGTPVAVKKLYTNRLENEQLAEFRSEVTIMSQLRHPNVVLFMGASTREPNLCIVTELLGKGSLFEVIKIGSNKVTWDITLKIALGTARGMNYLHCSKPPILHRDLKSLNILLDDTWGVKVCDFGFTVVKEKDNNKAQRIGTIQWMAPEILRGQRYDEKSDVYSFGIVLWELAAKLPPYPQIKADEVARKVLEEGLRPQIPPRCPPMMAQLMKDCWGDDPVKRPTFSQIINALEKMQLQTQTQR